MTETDNLILAYLRVFANYCYPGMTGPWPRGFRVITKFNFSVSMTQLITYESQPASVTTHLSMQPEGSTSKPSCRHDLTHITVKTVSSIECIAHISHGRMVSKQDVQVFMFMCMGHDRW